MSTTDGLYLLVEGELTKVTEDVLSQCLAEARGEPGPARKDRFEARAILGVMNQAAERIRIRNSNRQAVA